MANSTSIVPQVVEGANAVAKINSLFDPASLSMLGGRDASTSALLTWGYLGGRINGSNVANGTVTLTASATNYVVMAKSGYAVSSSTNTTNWNNSTDYWRLYQVATNSTTWTSYLDERFGTNGIFLPGLVALSNPMTGVGELIVGGTAGAPTKLAVGTDTHVLTLVSGIPTWAASPSGFSNPMTTAGDIIVGDTAGVAKRLAKGSAFQRPRMNSGATDVEWAHVTTCIPIACSDEVTPLTTGTGKVTFRMPFAMKVTAVRASLTTAQASGSIFTVDVNEAGASILSTKLTIDNTEKSSTTAATPPVISDADLADDAEITVDIDQVGDGTAKGLKVYLIGYVAQ